MPGGPFAEAISRSDVVFDIGAGDSFTDIYGARRFLTIWIAKARCILKGKRIILSPQTIGPFDRLWARRLARWALNRSVITTRDTQSAAFVRKLGVKNAILKTTDVAMRLPHRPSDKISAGRLRVGLNVSGLLMSGGYTESNQFGLRVDYPGLIRSIIRWFLDQPEVELHLVGHVQSESFALEDDQRVSLALASEFPGVIVSPVFASPIDAKSYISSLDFFVGSRMHATIAAFSSGVPVVPLAYSRKFVGVFGDLGYDHVVDLRTADGPEVMKQIESCFLNIEGLVDDIAKARENVDRMLDDYGDLARRIMSDS